MLSIELVLWLLLFLPPILCQAAIFTSWRDFRANLCSIPLLAVGLVVATTIGGTKRAHGHAAEPSGTKLL